MGEGVPLFNFKEIEELTGMVRSIQSDNTQKLDDILAEMVDIEQNSILGIVLCLISQLAGRRRMCPTI